MNDPTTRTVRRTVTTTRRVRREITVHLSPARASRLGVRLVLAGLKAFPSRRLIPLTLRTRPKSTSKTEIEEEVLGDEGHLGPTAGNPASLSRPELEDEPT